MYPIVKKKKLADKIFLMDVKAPRVAKSCLPGQFVIVKMDEAGERIPLTICDYDKEAGTVTIVFQIVGASTQRMETLEEGDAFQDFVGPLGRPSELTETPIEELKQKKIVFIAGGVGTAPVYPQVKWLHEQGVPCDVIMGSKTRDLLILADEMEKVAGNLYVTTDDGSYGFHGMGTNQLEALVGEGTLFRSSLNPIMVDGTGMCGACRVTVGDKVKFACVDGPEFDGHLVDFDQAMKRQLMYKTEEGRSLLKLQEGDSHHGGCGQCGGDK